MLLNISKDLNCKKQESGDESQPILTLLKVSK